MSKYYTGTSTDVNYQFELKGAMTYIVWSYNEVEKMRYFYLEFRTKIVTKFIYKYVGEVKEITAVKYKDRYKIKEGIMEKGKITELGLWFKLDHNPNLEGSGQFDDMRKIGYPNYEMNKQGQIRHKQMKQIITINYKIDYPVLCLTNKEGKRTRPKVHRLLAEMYIDNPEKKPQVDHIDRNPKNFNLDNLRWATEKEQCKNKNEPKENLNIGIFMFEDDKYVKHWRHIDLAIQDTKFTRDEIKNSCDSGLMVRKYRFFPGNYNNDFPGEIWKILVIKKDFRVSDFGRIERKGKKSIGNAGNDSYITTTIRNNGQDSYLFIHKLVLIAFVGKSDLQGNHKNGNKDDNRLDNLEYVTRSENMLHVHDQLSDKTRKAIIRLDKDGNIVARFKSGREADRHFNYRKQKVMDAVKRGNEIDGYFWKYEDEKNKVDRPRSKENFRTDKHIRSIYRIEEDGTIKHRFKSGNDADRYFGYRVGRISTAVLNEWKVEGFVWKRENC